MLSAYKNTAYVLLGGALCKAWQLIFSCFSLCALVKRCLIAYNHGKINEIQVEGIEKNLSRIISQFEDLKRDLVFLLSEKEE